MTASEQTDLVVIGGGPGGYPAALAAAGRDMKVILVTDEENLGGSCLHRGCIPSKALLHVAKLIHESAEAAIWGIDFGSPKIDLDKLRDWKSSVVGKLTGGIKELCRARDLKLIHASARFVNSQTIQLDERDRPGGQLKFRHAIVATGSSPVMPSMFDIDDHRVLNSISALELPEIPKRLLVIGGGYIGLEMGTVYAALGSKVTVIEMLSGLLPGVDRDLVRPLTKCLKESFEAIHIKTQVKKVTAKCDGIVVQLEGNDISSPQTFDSILVAVGRRPNTSGIGFEKTNVELDEKGFIKVDRQQRTTDPNILAVGDIVGEPMLAHKATRQAKVAVGALAGEPVEFDNAVIPAVVFTDPEIAWCGLTETEANTSGRPIKVARFPWAASGRAHTLGRTEGLTKLIFDPDTEQLLGMGIVGSGAGELIAEGVLGIGLGATARDVGGSMHAHPTLSETVMEAAESRFGQATHIAHKVQRQRF